MAVGFPAKTTYANGDVFSASDINDTNGTLNLASGAQWAAGKNCVINGNMAIDQRYNGSATANTISGYVVDRFQVVQSVTGKLIAQRNRGAVTPPAGFVYYLGITSQSAYSVTSTDFYDIRHFVEGLNSAQFAFGTASAKTVTLSFYVYSSLTGTFGGALINSAGDRSYPFSYTISAANTWERKTITIAGDTSGTWLTGSNVGIQISLSLGMGSTYSGTAGAWTGSYKASVTGAVSVVGTNGATFYATGMQLEAASSATAFAPTTPTYQSELAACQRYFQKFGGVAYYGFNTGRNTSTTELIFALSNKATMRTAPSITSSGNFATYNGTVSAIAIEPNLANADQTFVKVTLVGATAGQANILYANNDTTAHISASAEL